MPLQSKRVFSAQSNKNMIESLVRDAAVTVPPKKNFHIDTLGNFGASVTIFGEISHHFDKILKVLANFHLCKWTNIEHCLEEIKWI